MRRGVSTYAIAFLLMGVASLAMMSSPVSALSLRMQPLLYNATLGKGEVKNGSIDISNPTTETLTLATSVQAFKQIDSAGNLSFYDDQKIQAGIRPDLTEFTLKPGEALHLVFQLDSTKLPVGDVFAALFITIQPARSKIPQQVIRLGTLFTLVNGTPSKHEAAITALDAPLFTYGGSFKAVYEVKNTASRGVSSGFYPRVDASLELFGGHQTITSPLVFAGNSRHVGFKFDGDRLGIFQLRVRTGQSVLSRWVVIITGFWTWLLPVLIGLAIALISACRHYLRKRK
jgi:hypothetical protein